MKLLALLLILGLATVRAERNFRYSHGITKVGNNVFTKGEGVVWLWDNIVVYYGMVMDNMIPYMITGNNIVSNSKDGVIDITMNCTEGTWSNITFNDLRGTIRINGTYPELDFDCECVCVQTKLSWTFISTGIEVDNPYFYEKEAGRKARGLIGMPSSIFPSASIIEYSIWGYPYFGKDCLSFLGMCKEIEKEKPGAVVTDLKKCGILDDRGAKIIHANTVTHLVTQTSIALIKQVFPNGYVLLDCTGVTI